MVSTTYPSGKTIRYGLSSIKRPLTVDLENGANTTRLASTISYRPFGGMQRLDYDNGLQTLIGWDLDYRQINTRDLPVQELRYFYDAADNISEIRDLVDSTKTQTFAYDNLDRITGASGIYGNLGYTYDGVGNRLTLTENGDTDSYLYDSARNQIERVTSTSGEVTNYSHNDAGSIRRIGDDFYSYGQYERLLRTTIGGVATDYRYDGQGRRAIKLSASIGEVIYHYNLDGLLISETTSSGATIREYVYIDGQPLALLENGQIYYYHLNHLGTPQKLTNANQEIVWQGDYKPFGEANLVTEVVVNNIRFPGQYFDQESGLHYNYFRDFDPSSGRFVQSDPIGLGSGPNTYGYALQNPIAKYDPDGLEVRLLCRPLDGTLARTGRQHCFVFVTCPEEGWSATYSLFATGTNSVGWPNRGRKSADDRRDNPFSQKVASNGVASPNQCYSEQCGFEKAVRNRYDSFPSGDVPYNPFGPNSNSFANDLIVGAGGSLPSNAPGPRIAPGINQRHPNFP